MQYKQNHCVIVLFFSWKQRQIYQQKRQDNKTILSLLNVSKLFFSVNFTRKNAVNEILTILS